MRCLRAIKGFQKRIAVVRGHRENHRWILSSCEVFDPGSDTTLVCSKENCIKMKPILRWLRLPKQLSVINENQFERGSVVNAKKICIQAHD